MQVQRQSIAILQRRIIGQQAHIAFQQFKFLAPQLIRFLLSRLRFIIGRSDHVPDHRLIELAPAAIEHLTDALHFDLAAPIKQRSQIRPWASQPRFHTNSGPVGLFSLVRPPHGLVEDSQFQMGATSFVGFQHANNVLIDGVIEFFALRTVEQY